MDDSNLSKDARISQPESLEPEVFERDPRDKDHPYSIVSNALAQNGELSFACRGFLIYLLSLPKDWKISIPYIRKTQKISKQGIYDLINEAIDAGYLCRKTFLKNNLKRFKYLWSEVPRFKKSFRCPGFREAEIRDPENADTYKVYKNNKVLKENKYTPSALASELTDFFIEELKKRKPDLKEPPKQKWIAEMDRMLRIDKRDPKKVKAVISWLMNDPFWFGNILSIPKLRKQFDQLEIKMSSSKSPPIIKKYPIEEHKRKAQILKNKWWKESNVKLEDDEIIFYAPGGCQSYRFGTQECEDLLNKTIKTKSL